jgi:gliding motility-associated-like protein
MFDPCSFFLSSVSVAPDSLWNTLDCDGDGVTNGIETSDVTNPLDPCSYENASISLPITTTVDCDGDGVTNANEFDDGTDATDPCSYDPDNITVVIVANVDCDSDGLTDSLEIANGSNPFDACDPDNNNLCNEDLFIPEGFSPNGDGVNDVFVIRGLNNYDKREVLFLNRWGNKVYESQDYKNDWDGTNQFGTSRGNELPVATYFYIFNFGTTTGGDPIIFKGFIYLNR